MAHDLERPRCLLCPRDDDLVGIVVGARPAWLCAVHHARYLRAGAPRFDTLSQLFRHHAFDRREGPTDRRQRLRRQFPPRPEGRRHDAGRRAGDPPA
ncbi:MAG: hypothetical protein AAGN82_23970 [Myxococcota bacterium]